MYTDRFRASLATINMKKDLITAGLSAAEIIALGFTQFGCGPAPIAPINNENNATTTENNPQQSNEVLKITSADLTMFKAENQKKDIISSLPSDRPKNKDDNFDVFKVKIGEENIKFVMYEIEDEEVLNGVAITTTHNGQETISIQNIALFTEVIEYGGTRRWERLIATNPSLNGENTVWIYDPNGFPKESRSVDTSRAVFGYNLDATNVLVQPIIIDPDQIEGYDYTQALPVVLVDTPSLMKNASPIKLEAPAEPQLPKKLTPEEISQMTPAEILAQAPELEGYEKWRAAGKYAMYLNTEGQVEKAYDMTIGEYRDIPDYPVTTPENFPDSEISAEELFNGDYFLWLEKEAKNLTCSPNMRTDVPMVTWNGVITPNPDTAPNFAKQGSEFFIRDHTAGFTRYLLPDGQEVHYTIMPLFMCDANKNIYPIITVHSAYNPNTNRTQDEDNVLYMTDGVVRWRNDMKVTTIVPNANLDSLRGGMEDPLVAQTFKLNADLQEKFASFVNGDFGSLSRPGIVLLNRIASNRAHKYE